MLKLGIIGYPLEHSLSPLMHNAALKELSIDGHYEILETPVEKLPELISLLKAQDYRGFNITIPHKIAIINYLDTIDSFAKSVGAVNTVVIDKNKALHGYNTDVYGFVHAIPKEIRENLKGKQAAVLGSGGAARAVIAGLAETGIEKIAIYARNMEKALELKNIFPKSDIQCLNLPEEQNKIDFSEYIIVVNTTPLGMYGKNLGCSPINEETISSLPDNAFVYDIIYRPRKTKLLELAEKHGLKTLDGLEMLVLQGAKAFELWTEKNAPVNIMRNAILS